MTIYLAMVLLLSFISPSNCEETSFSELALWLPDGVVYALNWTDYRRSEFEECLNNYLGTRTYPSTLEHFEENTIWSYASAIYCNDTISEQSDQIIRGPGNLSVADGSGTAFVMDISNSKVSVALINNLKQQISNLNKQQKVIPTGEKIGQFPLLTMTVKNRRTQQDSKLFLCPTDVDILLIAQTREMLATMVKTGLGEEQTLADSRYIDIVEEFGDRIKHGFFLKDEYGYRDHILKMIGSSHLPKKDYDSPLFRISAFNHEVCKRYEINVYSTEELAINELNGWRQAAITGAQGDRFAEREFRKIQRKHQSYETVGTAFILAIHFTPEYKKAGEEERKAREAIRSKNRKRSPSH